MGKKQKEARDKTPAPVDPKEEAARRAAVIRAEARKRRANAKERAGEDEPAGEGKKEGSPTSPETSPRTPPPAAPYDLTINKTVAVFGAPGSGKSIVVMAARGPRTLDLDAVAAEQRVPAVFRHLSEATPALIAANGLVPAVFAGSGTVSVLLRLARDKAERRLGREYTADEAKHHATLTESAERGDFTFVIDADGTPDVVVRRLVTALDGGGLVGAGTREKPAQRKEPAEGGGARPAAPAPADDKPASKPDADRKKEGSAPPSGGHQERRKDERAAPARTERGRRVRPERYDATDEVTDPPPETPAPGGPTQLTTAGAVRAEKLVMEGSWVGEDAEEPVSEDEVVGVAGQAMEGVADLLATATPCCSDPADDDPRPHPYRAKDGSWRLCPGASQIRPGDPPRHRRVVATFPSMYHTLLAAMTTDADEKGKRALVGIVCPAKTEGTMMGAAFFDVLERTETPAKEPTDAEIAQADDEERFTLMWRKFNMERGALADEREALMFLDPAVAIVVESDLPKTGIIPGGGVPAAPRPSVHAKRD